MRWSEEELAAYLRRGQPPVLTERAWQSAVMRIAKDAGYTFAYHTYRSTKSMGGFPDLILCHKDAHTDHSWPIWAVELKTDVGQVSAAQQAWLDALAGSRGVIADIWRPADLERIVAQLRL